MINAGAIASAGLVEGKTAPPSLSVYWRASARMQAGSLRWTGRYSTPKRDGPPEPRDRPHAAQFQYFGGGSDAGGSVYFQQCSVSVNCRDLALMAATLADRGVNPVTGKQALRGEYVESVLSVMGSCGMYDYAGEWIVQHRHARQKWCFRRCNRRGSRATGYRCLFASTRYPRKYRPRNSRLR